MCTTTRLSYPEARQIIPAGSKRVFTEEHERGRESLKDLSLKGQTLEPLTGLCSRLPPPMHSSWPSLQHRDRAKQQRSLGKLLLSCRASSEKGYLIDEASGTPACDSCLVSSPRLKYFKSGTAARKKALRDRDGCRSVQA